MLHYWPKWAFYWPIEYLVNSSIQIAMRLAEKNLCVCHCFDVERLKCRLELVWKLDVDLEEEREIGVSILEPES